MGRKWQDAYCGHVSTATLHTMGLRTRSTRILLRKGHDLRVFHLQRTNKRCVSLDGDIILLAEGCDVRPCIERMHLNLVDRGYDSWFRIKQLLQLPYC